MLDNLGRDRVEVLHQTLEFGTELKMETRINSFLRGISIYSLFFEAGNIFERSQKIGAAITYLDPEILGMID
jgi:hypothetical protein